MSAIMLKANIAPNSPGHYQHSQVVPYTPSTPVKLKGGGYQPGQDKPSHYKITRLSLQNVQLDPCSRDLSKAKSISPLALLPSLGHYTFA